MARMLVVPGLLVCTTTGCDDRAVDAHAPAVRDSAGIAIVENRSEFAEKPAWQLSEAPELEIGRTEGEGPDLFGAIRQVIRLEGGRIAVADGRAREIRVFDPDGTHVLTFGRPGEGPGEFSGLWWIGALPGDSIAAVDNLSGRVSVFAPDGEFGRSFRVPRLEGGTAPNVVGALRDGTLVLSTPTAPPSQDTRSSSTILIYAVGPEGEVTGRAGEHRDRDLGENGLGVGFGGHAMVAAGDSLIWYAHNSRFSLQGLTPDGSIQRIVRLERAPGPVTEEEISEARSAVEESLVRQGASASVMQRIMDTEFADHHPVHGRVLEDRAGFLWVAKYQAPSYGEHMDTAAEAWDVFDPEGRWRTQVAMPSGFRVSEVGEDFVLGTHTDGLGVQRVRLYSLDRHLE